MKLCTALFLCEAALGNIKLPLAFEANHGQAPAQVRFLAHGAGYTALLSSNAVEVRSASAGGFQMRFIGASREARLDALDALPGKTNYIVGRDARNWHTGIPTFGSVRYRGLYRNIDLIFHSSPAGQLEYDFQVAPGGDPRVIRMAFEGARPVRIDAQGNLVLAKANAEWLEHKPRIFQGQTVVDGHYELLAGGSVGFRIGRFDRSKPLIIDPAISYATYLGTSSTAGNGSFSEITAIAVDAGGSVYVTGFTSSADFPVTAGAYGTKFYGACSGGTCANAFVAKLNPAGTAVVYATFLSGSGGSGGAAIAADTAGNAYVAGITGSLDFPITPGALRTTNTGQDGFLAKLDPSGAKLLYSTFLGLGAQGAAQSLAISPSGDLYLAGQTNSPDFPILNALQPGYGGGTYQAGYLSFPCWDAFVMHWRFSDMSLVYATYLGGSSNDAANAMAIDSAGNVYVAGTTYSQDFPVVNALQPAPGGGTCATSQGPDLVPCPSAFVSKIGADGKLLYATYVGGKGNNTGAGIAVDSAGDAYVTGSTDALNFPTVNALQPTLQSGNCQPPASGTYGEQLCGDAFIAKLNPQGSALLFSSYFGGESGVTSAGPVAVDSSGNAYVALTPSWPLPPGLPITSGTLSPCAGGVAGAPALLAGFGPEGSLLYSALFGGTTYESIAGLVLV